MATLTLIGLYNYDDTIFNNMHLPAQLDFETVKNAILLNCSEFEVLYPSPDAMKAAIDFWSKSKLHQWEKIATALYHDYNPFINFTRDERRETEYTPNLLKTRTANLQDQRTNSATENQTVNETSVRTPELDTTATSNGTSNTKGDATATHKTAAWNDADMANATQEIQNSSGSSIDRGESIEKERGKETNTRSGSDNKTSTGTDTSKTTGTDTYADTGNAKTVETFHSEGDSAMFTPTDVARKEAELRLSFDMIDIIIDSFKTNLVLAIY